eukprot:INCI13501.16.p1 GENE.INCI13501.16~~INCI13501.16.p1  ORF type:complete len:1107 (+),score=167.90 INCI13501.16:979-4299(+)
MLITACARILADHVAQLNADSSKDTEAAVDVASLALGAQKQSPIGDEEAQPSSIAAAIQNTIERSECGLLLVEQMRKMVTQEAATSRTLAEETRLPVAVLEGKADSETLLVQQLSQSNAHIQLCDSLAKSFASGPATTPWVDPDFPAADQSILGSELARWTSAGANEPKSPADVWPMPKYARKQRDLYPTREVLDFDGHFSARKIKAVFANALKLRAGATNQEPVDSGVVPAIPWVRVERFFAPELRPSQSEDDTQPALAVVDNRHSINTIRWPPPLSLSEARLKKAKRHHGVMFPALLSAFAVLAEPAFRPVLRDFTFLDCNYRRCGHYRLRMFASSLDARVHALQPACETGTASRVLPGWHSYLVPIDDQFPASSTAATTGAVPLFAGPASAASSRFDNGEGAPSHVTSTRVVGNELWPMLLEKALAKIHGSYVALRRLTVGDVWTHVTGHLSTRLNLLPLRLNEKEEDVSDSENSDSDDESDGGSDSDGTSKKKKKKKRRKKKKKTKPAASSRKAKFAGRDRLWARLRTALVHGCLCAALPVEFEFGTEDEDRSATNLGVMPGYCCSVLDAVTVTEQKLDVGRGRRNAKRATAVTVTHRLLQLRVPYAADDFLGTFFKWRGQWNGESSRMWSAAAREQCGYLPHETACDVPNGDGQSRGLFWIALDDFVDNFKVVWMCRSPSAAKMKIFQHLSVLPHCTVRGKLQFAPTARDSKQLFVSPVHEYILRPTGSGVVEGLVRLQQRRCRDGMYIPIGFDVACIRSRDQLVQDETLASSRPNSSSGKHEAEKKKTKKQEDLELCAVPTFTSGRELFDSGRDSGGTDAHATISATFLVEPAHDYRVLVYAVRSSLYPLAERWEKDGVDYELSAETCSAPLRITSRQKPDHEMDSPLLWERQNPAGGVESGAQTPETTRLADSSLTLKERWSNVLIKRAVAFGQPCVSKATRPVIKLCEEDMDAVSEEQDAEFDASAAAEAAAKGLAFKFPRPTLGDTKRITPRFLVDGLRLVYTVTNNFEDRVVVLTPDLSRLRDHRFALLVDDAEVVEEGLPRRDIRLEPSATVLACVLVFESEQALAKVRKINLHPTFVYDRHGIFSRRPKGRPPP